MSVSNISVAQRANRTATSIRIAPRSLVNEIVDVADVPEAAWRDLAARALEPNLFYEPIWMRAVARHARIGRGARVLLAWDTPRKQRLIGLLPVVTAWRARKLPVPMFIAWQPYVPLRTPLLDKFMPEAAAHGLIDAAIAAGAEALLLPQQKVHGRVFEAFRHAMQERRLSLEVQNRRERASLNAASDAETLLQESLGAKKAKELRRQRNRLADLGALSLEVATLPEDALPALENFLQLEASGWKGKRGTALVQNKGTAAFIREAARGLSNQGQFEVLALRAAETLVASCLVLRNGKTTFFFKLAHDERHSKNSPGVQLTLDLTRHLCADDAVEEVDSTADANHPMIDHIWRDRIALGDAFIPLKGKTLRTTIIRSQIAVHAALYRRARIIFHRLRAIREKFK
jgi:CelD/BcsL family acetyltransferase involved in cellulose biosynthesis